jgi:hypothetical protein
MAEGQGERVTNLLFVATLGAALWLAMRWAFKHLPGEEWQFLAAVPTMRGDADRWEGINLTYYGFLSASAYTIGVALLLALLSSIAVPLLASGGIILVLLGLCAPASRWIARIIEGKQHTFTVGGASFVGIILAPWTIGLFNVFLGLFGSVSAPVLPSLAAMSIAYAFGEGIGRLACISFGCCYGQSLREAHPLWQRLFSRFHFVFSGQTKKIAYAGGPAGEPVIPIQAVTAVCYVATGLLAMSLFLSSHFAASFLLAVGVTQVWRAFSEFLRADYRGDQPISAYQIMAALAIVYSLFVFYALPPSMTIKPDILLGFKALWNPPMLLLLQALWVASFLYTGRSRVTGSTLSFHVNKDRI